MFRAVVAAAVISSGLCAPVSAQFADTGSGGSAGAPLAGGGAAFAPSTDQVRNGALGVRVLFVGKNPDGKTLTVSAELQNLAEEPIYIALVGPQPAAIDTLGITYSLDQAAGLAQCKSLSNDAISRCFSNYTSHLPGAAFSMLQPGASAITALTFGADQTSDSGFLSVTMNVALATGTRPSDDRNSDSGMENVAISFPLIALEDMTQ